MGILDSVFGEATKWLLGKVDKKLKGEYSPNRAVVYNLYDYLCNIDEYLVKYRNDILHYLLYPPYFRYDSLKGLTKYDWAEGYRYHIRSHYCPTTKYIEARKLLYSEIRDALYIFNSIGRTIALESEQDKEFWDDIVQYLRKLQKCLDETNTYCYTKKDFVHMIMVAKDLEKQFDNTTLTNRCIKELKNYINMKWPQKTT